MKNTITFCILLFLILNIPDTIAQKKVIDPDVQPTVQRDFKKVQFGLGLGLNIASLSAEWDEYLVNGEEFSSKAGFNVGAHVKFRPARVFAFQLGLQLSSKGHNTWEGKSISLTYLNVPLAFKFYLYQGLNLEFGPMLSILPIANYTYEDEDPVNLMDYSAFIPIDIALGFGMNYELNFGLCFGFRYNLGLFNINNDFLYIEEIFDWGNSYPPSRSEFPIKNRVLQMNVIYYF